MFVHPLAFGVIVTVAVMGAFVVFATLKLGIFPVPCAANPMAGWLFVHAKVVPVTGLVNTIVDAESVFVYVKFCNVVPMVAVGFTVIV